jgi:hypothetical protein
MNLINSASELISYNGTKHKDTQHNTNNMSHYDNIHKDFTYNRFTYNINKLDITYTFFLIYCYK